MTEGRAGSPGGDPDDEALPAGSAPRPAVADDGLDDDMWWVRSLGGSTAPDVDPLLPTSERLRREIAGLPASLAELDTESEVRTAVDGLNTRIADWSRHLVVPGSGERTGGIDPVDVDEAVARWEAARTRRDEHDPAPTSRRRPWRRRGAPVVDGK